MEQRVEKMEEAPGVALGRMLAGQRMFLENVYALLRFLEAEVGRRGWELVRNGGYAVTRNGTGRGLSSFASADWVVDQAGIAFVPAGCAKTVKGATNTAIPPEGLDLLAFQVRWLDKAPGEPVVWAARLRVEAVAGREPEKWEDVQNATLNRLEPEPREEGVRAGAVEPGQASVSGKAILFTGQYLEVPVVELQTQEDVVMQLVEPGCELR